MGTARIQTLILSPVLFPDTVQVSQSVLMTVSSKFPKGTSLAVQWLRLCASTAGGTGSIPGQGTKILHPAKLQLYRWTLLSAQQVRSHGKWFSIIEPFSFWTPNPVSDVIWAKTVAPSWSVLSRLIKILTSRLNGLKKIKINLNIPFHLHPCTGLWGRLYGSWLNQKPHYSKYSAHLISYHPPRRFSTHTYIEKIIAT